MKVKYNESLNIQDDKRGSRIKKLYFQSRDNWDFAFLKKIEKASKFITKID